MTRWRSRRRELSQMGAKSGLWTTTAILTWHSENWRTQIRSFRSQIKSTRSPYWQTTSCLFAWCLLATSMWLCWRAAYINWLRYKIFQCLRTIWIRRLFVNLCRESTSVWKYLAWALKRQPSTRAPTQRGWTMEMTLCVRRSKQIICRKDSSLISTRL